MDQNKKNLNKTGGVLQCEPTKANKEAHTSNMNDNIIVPIQPWNYLVCDLDAIAYISHILEEQGITGYSFALKQDAYSMLTMFKYIKKKDPKGYYDISIKDVSNRAYFGNSDKKDIQNIKKTVKLLSKVSFLNHGPIIKVENRTGDIKTVFLHKNFDYLINQIVTTKSEHDYLKINSTIYNQYLSKIKKQQRAYAVFLEKLFQESKAFLERSSFSIPYSRQHITLQRIAKYFNPQKKHTAKEIYDSGEKILKQIFGNNIDAQIQKLAQSITTTDELKKFAAKKSGIPNVLNTPISHLLNEQSAVNDKYFVRNHKEIRMSEK